MHKHMFFYMFRVIIVFKVNHHVCVYIMFVMMFVYICATTNPKFLLFNVPFSLVDSDDEKIELYAKKTF